MPNDGDGLGYLDRLLTHIDKMMRTAIIMRDAEDEEIDFWSAKHDMWMRRTMAVFESILKELGVLYQNHSVFVPDIRLMKVMEKAERLALVINNFTASHDKMLKAREQAFWNQGPQAAPERPMWLN